MSLFYGIIRGASVEFEKDHEWMAFTQANQGRKIYLDVGFETKQRSPKQNNSLWLGLTQLANALNDSGKDMRAVLKQEINIPWDKDTVHDYLLIPILKAMKQKSSTTEITKEEITSVWDVMFRELGEKHNVEYIPFPSQLSTKSL